MYCVLDVDMGKHNNSMLLIIHYEINCQQIIVNLPCLCFSNGDERSWSNPISDSLVEGPHSKIRDFQGSFMLNVLMFRL
jgi:hypothetical protein